MRPKPNQKTNKQTKKPEERKIGVLKRSTVLINLNDFSKYSQLCLFYTTYSVGKSVP